MGCEAGLLNRDELILNEMRILIADGLHARGLEVLSTAAQVDDRAGISPETLLDAIPKYDALIVRGRTKVSEEVFAAGKSLKVVGRAGVGVDNIDLTAAKTHGVIVINTPRATSLAVAEHTLGLMLALARLIPRADASMKTGKWLKKELTGVELNGKVLGVIGAGKIGSAVAHRADFLGMRVLGYDPHRTKDEMYRWGAQPAALANLYAQADFVSLHVPLMEATKNLVNADRIALMKDGGVLVNFSRGGIVDNAAAIAALDSGKLHAFVSDFPTPELIAHPKAVALPHLGASTTEAEENCAVMVAENVKDYLENGNIRFSVNFPEARLPRLDAWRITLANKNVPNMVGQVSTCIANAGLNIEDLLNKSVGEFAYTIVDVNAEPSQELLDAIGSIDGVLILRNLGKPV